MARRVGVAARSVRWGWTMLLALVSACHQLSQPVAVGQQSAPLAVQAPVPLTPPASAPGAVAAVPVGEPLDLSGLQLRLSAGEPEAATPTQHPQAQTQPLTAAQTNALLGRLPALQTQPADKPAFALRGKSLPQPRPGTTERTTLATFPPPSDQGAPPSVAPKPLEVLRYGPEGDVDVAPRIAVTFSQPMVPVTSQEELAKIPVPIAIAPQTPGEWRWLGTQTAAYQPRERLPMASIFLVTIPAGTRSATGNKLEKPVQFSLRTPVARVTSMEPQGEGQPLDPAIVLHFDQDVDPAAVAKVVSATAQGKPLALRLLSRDEAAQHPRLVNRIGSLDADGRARRWLAFAASQPLPRDAAVQVKVGPNLSSAEGPRVNNQTQVFNFRTYAPLRLTDQRCGWDKTCPPLTPWSLRFNNMLNVKAFDKGMVRIEPEIPDAQISLHGNTIWIHGATRGNTTYKISVDAALRDVYDQTLGKPLALKQVTTRAEPAFRTQGDWMTVVDPMANQPTVSVWTVNYAEIKVKIWQVEPTDWSKWLDYQRDKSRSEELNKLVPPGKLVVDTALKPQGGEDDPVETRIDLRPALKNGLGHAIVRVEVPKLRQWEPQRFETWAQVTQLGVTAVADKQQLQVLTTELKTGKPAAGTDVTLIDRAGKVRGTSAVAADGSATLPLPTEMSGAGMLLARRGDDRAILSEGSWWGDSSEWVKQSYGSHTRFHLIDDRGLYRPGETVHCKGWVRTIGQGPTGDVSAFGGAKQVYWRVRDSHGNEITKGNAPVGPNGTFALEFALPKDVHLGQLRVHVGLSESAYDDSHSLRVEEFRRPEFETTTQVDPGPYVLGDHAVVTTSARYYAGGTLPGADVRWELSAQPGQFDPPGHEGWTFGDRPPWWMWRGYDEDRPHRHRGDEHQRMSRLSSDGKDLLRLDFVSGAPVQPWTVTTRATVSDVNRQTWTSAATMLVHPSQAYVGLRLDRSFVDAGQPVQLGVLACDIDGKLAVGQQVAVRIFRQVSEQDQGTWKTVERDVTTCAVVQGQADDGKCAWQPQKGGLWHVEATTQDAKGRPNRTALQVYVAGKDAVPDRSTGSDDVKIIPDKQTYAPGDVAKLLVMAPWPGAEGELTFAREGRVARQHLHFDGMTATAQLTIEDGHTPGLWAHVALVGQGPRKSSGQEALDAKMPPQPVHASGSKYLPIPPRHRTLQVAVQPEQTETAPGAKTWLDVTVRDARGAPLRDADVLVVMVDDAVLALTGYRLASPLTAFYPQRSEGLRMWELRQWLLLATNPLLTGEAGGGGLGLSGLGMGGGGVQYEPGSSFHVFKSATTGAMPAPSATAKGMPMAKRAMAMAEEKEAAADEAPGEGGQAGPAIALRTNFNALAVFAPDQKTDGDGKTRVNVTLPDNLSRYRVMVIAAHGAQQFGQGEATVTARLPLMIRPSAPRFANYGDQFELPVVLQNQTTKPLAVQLAARASVLQLAGATQNSLGVQLTVPPQDRVEVRLPTTAMQVGTGRVQFAIAAGTFTDAAEIALPVWTPATTEAFATYGVLDSDQDGQGVRVQPLRVPTGVVPQFGGLQVTTSATALQGLTDAVIYLLDYPFGCSEQISSRVMAVAALRDVLTAFKAPGLPDKAALEAAVARDLAELAKMQHDDGSFGFWKRGDRPWPVLGLHVAHALIRAEQKGFAVPQQMLKRSKYWLRQIERHIPQDYPLVAKQVLHAQALYVRLQGGDRDVARAKTLLKEVKRWEDFPLEGLGWLWPVLAGDPSAADEVAAIRKLVNNRVEEQAGNAHFTTSYADGAHLILASDRRADAILLDALMTDQPKSDLIPKLVSGLLAHRKAGRWGSTQENAWVLLALDRYFRTYEHATPDFVARLWIGNEYAGESEFKGRTTERKQLEVPMALLQSIGQTPPLTIAKRGPGRMYYRLGMNYAPTNLQQAALDRGFQVARKYEAVDDPGDVTTDADGTLRVKAGVRVRVTVTMVNAARRYHVALVDPLPAGFEAINGDLNGSQPPPPTTQSASQRWWWGRWYEHANLRDERAEAFASMLWQGEWTYSYVARATTPGTFVVPPAKAEEMYSPEVFGRSASAKILIQGVK